MAHLLIDEPQNAKPKKIIHLPSMAGRFGVSVMLGKHEVFAGFMVSKVDAEEFTKVHRLILPGKGSVKDL